MSLTTQIETRAGSVAAAHKLLGVSRTTWYEYRRGATALPLYIERSIRAHLVMGDAEWQAFTRWGEMQKCWANQAVGRSVPRRADHTVATPE